jgi:hypothetical protein
MAMSPRLLRPRATGFNPKSISGLAVWLDASVGGSLFQNNSGTVSASATGEQVGYIADLSGNGRNATQGTANNRPLLSAANQNGKRGLTFDNTNDSLSLGNISAAFSSSEGTGFFVYKIAIDNIYTVFRTRSNNCVTQENNLGQWTYNGAWRTTRLNKLATSLPHASGSSAVVHTLQASASVYEMRNNGSVVTTTTGNWNAGDSYELMADSAGGAWTNGTLYEVILYSRFLSDSERQRVEKALGLKWGITI